MHQDRSAVPYAGEFREQVRAGSGMRRPASFAVLEQADLFTGVESAPQHAAAAIRVPALVLLGPSAKRLAGHRGARTLCPPWCAFYRQTGVWRRCSHRCMAGLPVSEVEVAITNMEVEHSLLGETNS